jgi:hypothetical protein
VLPGASPLMAAGSRTPGTEVKLALPAPDLELGHATGAGAHAWRKHAENLLDHGTRLSLKRAKSLRIIATSISVSLVRTFRRATGHQIHSFVLASHPPPLCYPMLTFMLHVASTTPSPTGAGEAHQKDWISRLLLISLTCEPQPCCV